MLIDPLSRRPLLRKSAMREVRTKGTVLLEKCQAVEMPHTTSSLCLSPIPQKSLDKGRFSDSHSFPRGVHKNILFTNSPGLDSFTNEFYQTFKKNYNNFIYTFPGNREN